MNFEKFIQNAKNPEAKQKAIEGFHLRQQAREARFEQEAKSREPSPQWYRRRYII